ncbi:MAG TPA: triose-phosphate isomerase [Myxococcales bacterium]|nr:triose-phosphate isomerase [Myxococcales bacterium]
MRRKFICGNWKMHKTAGDAAQLVRELREKLKTQAEVAVAPPFTALQAAKKELQGSAIQLFAQNCHHEKQGAFTGEVSAPMLADAGCHGVILGHSERRQYFGETDEGVNRKLRAALEAKLHPIVCVGESLLEREAGRTWEVVSRQVRGALAGFAAGEIGRCTLAYEPVWAIGTGKTATTSQAQEVHAQIRELLRELAGAAVADAIRIQYGGSVKPENAADLMAQPDIDGALVGGASLKADDFARIVAGAG